MELDPEPAGPQVFALAGIITYAKLNGKIIR
jgi:hypothetical protein